MPITVIRELVEKFDIEPVLRQAKMDMTGEMMNREILVLRGDLETVRAAEKYMFEALDRKLAEWNRGDKEEKYRKYYEEQARLRLKEVKDNPEAVSSGRSAPVMLPASHAGDQSSRTHLFFPSQSLREQSLIDVGSISFSASLQSTGRSSQQWDWEGYRSDRCGPGAQ